MIPFLSSWGRASKGPPLPVPAHEARRMAQQRWQLASAVSTPPLPRVRSIGMPAAPPYFPLRHSPQASHTGTLRLPPTLFISRFHVKHTPSHRVGMATAQTRSRCPVRAVNLKRRCAGAVFPNRMRESSNLLHGSVPSDDTQRMRSGALRTSVLRVRACMRSHIVFIARQRTGSSPREGARASRSRKPL